MRTLYTVRKLRNAFREVVQSVGAGSTFAAYVAKTGEALAVKSTEKDPRFPQGIFGQEVSSRSIENVNAFASSPTFASKKSSFKKESELCALLHPITASTGDKVPGMVKAVIEFARDETDSDFELTEQEMASMCATMACVSVYALEQRDYIARNKELGDFLMTVVK